MLEYAFNDKELAVVIEADDDPGDILFWVDARQSGWRVLGYGEDPSFTAGNHISYNSERDAFYINRVSDTRPAAFKAKTGSAIIYDSARKNFYVVDRSYVETTMTPVLRPSGDILTDEVEHSTPEVGEMLNVFDTAPSVSENNADPES